MKLRLTFFAWLLLFGAVITLQAQPVQRLVQVIVTPDHSDWQYKTGEEAVFDVCIYRDNILMKDVTVDYEIGPEFFPTEIKENISLKGGKITLKSKMKEPGFLRCKVVARVDGKRYEGLATAGYDVERIQPTTREPDDFETFWSEAIRQARKTPLDSRMILLPERCTATHNVYEVSFQNEQPNSRMYGIITIPKKEGKYPAILHVPGAGIRPYNGASYGAGIITLEIGIHGMSVTLPAEVYANLGRSALNGYQTYNMNKRDSHYYKRVYLGCVRAVDFIFSLPEFDGGTVGVAGGSQGGALSIVTTALDPRIRFLVAYYPALCDYAGYLNRRAGGWPHYFRNAEPQPGEVETLAYFDVVNFARRVKVPGWYSWGFNDTTCPPTSMHAAYNVIPGEKHLSLYPVTGHWTYPEQKEKGNRWLQKKAGGVE